MRRTPLYQTHSQAGAQFVDFSGWEMPIHYGSQLQEHRQVRNAAGLFDVSHMTVVDIRGEDACYFLRHICANDVAKLKMDGEALYSCLLNEAGGVVDDLIIYRMGEAAYRLVVNSATRDKDLAWLNHHAERYDITLHERDDLAIIALQGPRALAVLDQVFDAELVAAVRGLRPFKFTLHQDMQIAKTGYTGEEGVEILLPATEASQWWTRFIKAGALPCGLGARDTLRLEAGLNLYGADMDESTSPLVSNLAWTVDWRDERRDFIGKEALKKQIKRGVGFQLVGLVMQEPGMLRNHQAVFSGGKVIGELTSGSFSPTLGHAIGLARIPLKFSGDLTVERRGVHVPVSVVKLPFVRHGKKVYTCSFAA